MVALLVASSVVVALIVSYIINLLSRSRLSGIPGPRFYLPLIGEGLEFSKLGPVRFMYGRFLKHGPIFRANLGFQEMVVLGDPALLRAWGQGSMEFNVPLFSIERLLGDLRHMKHGGIRHKIFVRVNGCSEPAAPAHRPCCPRRHALPNPACCGPEACSPSRQQAAGSRQQAAGRALRSGATTRPHAGAWAASPSWTSARAALRVAAP
jgi:hypothetical protein